MPHAAFNCRTHWDLFCARCPNCNLQSAQGLSVTRKLFRLSPCRLWRRLPLTGAETAFSC
eukprot:11771153-Alexandrium_andersonii.AAC.1